jgi:hypothetical protein
MIQAELPKAILIDIPQKPWDTALRKAKITAIEYNGENVRITQSITGSIQIRSNNNGDGFAQTISHKAAVSSCGTR